MKRLLLLAGCLSTTAFAVRLGVTDDLITSTNQGEGIVPVVVTDEGDTERTDDITIYVVPPAMSMCAVSVTSTKQYTHFVSKVTRYSQFSTNGNGNYEEFRLWRWGAEPQFMLSKDGELYPYPLWDHDEAKFRFTLSVYDDGTSEYEGKFRHLPARRQYLIFIGNVKSDGKDDDKNHAFFTLPEEACTSGAKIRYKYVIDFFKTGDDFTKWVRDYGMGDHAPVGDASSWIHERWGKHEFEGNLFKKISKSDDARGFWIVDATYIDYVDRVTGDHVAYSTDAGNSRFVTGTFWAHFSDWRELDTQQNELKKVWWLTNKFQAKKLEAAFSTPTFPTDFFDTAPLYNKQASATGAVESAYAGTSAFFGYFDYKDADAVQHLLPIIVCGLFPKTFPSSKGCRRKKAESEG